MTTTGGTDLDTTVAAYLDLRARLDTGEEQDWTTLARFFTDDAVYIDPAWGRVEGIDEIRAFLRDSMAGLEGWTFPVEHTAVTGDTLVVKWTQQLPGRRADGRPYTQSGYSTLVYAGDGKFSYEEDVLNMAHVIEDIVASGWTPGEGFNPPPRHPDRRWHRPPG